MNTLDSTSHAAAIDSTVDTQNRRQQVTKNNTKRVEELQKLTNTNHGGTRYSTMTKKLKDANHRQDTI